MINCYWTAWCHNSKDMTATGLIGVTTRNIWLLLDCMVSQLERYDCYWTAWCHNSKGMTIHRQHCGNLKHNTYQILHSKSL
jgi:hypothetical protein